jgi:hypothetical protein
MIFNAKQYIPSGINASYFLSMYGIYQCCRAETICFCSSACSDFQKVSAPAPAPELAPALT